MNHLDLPPLSTQDPHRVISFPASQSLHASTAFPDAASGRKAIPTGLVALDEAISAPVISTTTNERIREFTEGKGEQLKGLPVGHVTEVFGPPGAGKTMLGLNATAGALGRGEGVVWIDTASPLPRPRLRKLLESQSPTSPSSPRSLTENLTYIRAPTLPHLLSLFHHPPASFPPPNTTLLVIDSVSAPFTPYFPNPSDINQPQQAQRDVQKWLTTRKWNVISDLAAQLVKFASRANLAILVNNQTHTRIRGQVRATLSPILSGRGWESCVRARIGVYGDFGDGGDGGWVRVAEVMKRDGRLVTVRDKTTVVPFRVANDGLYAVAMGLEGNEEDGVAAQVREKQAQDEDALEPEEPMEEEPVEEEEPELEDYQAQDDSAQEEVAPEDPAPEEPASEESAQEESAPNQPAPEEPVIEALAHEEPVHEGHTQEHIQKIQTQEIQAQKEQAQDVHSDSAPDTASQRKRKAEEIADSQDEEDSEGVFE
ncbi:P-loop containing nucleoside triphosphate hydrolase protein [Aspergillus costaricaensis CBS 115574]|uniref:P-loop containing nucleoside triphosphate hydrolase protein n=1 Tax=Aspergillus costaricaensis CBS 115574 TaxID=1448317 RepID=A0ACD1IIJ8_9EURO|nr:P-loop containing nucleoside triphosphate hydrolase protein [Aspergillus costaricaensis CBS 115574]RAK89855.1 P-loop containing nucleoside triphosphate hydrolase protein [Aspergillus costaricaensis CBS 115574]